MSDLLSRGEGRTVTISGRPPCKRCGTAVVVEFTGAEDSLGAQFARSMMDGPTCEACEELEEREERAQLELDRRAAVLAQRIERSGVPETKRGVDFGRLDRDGDRAEAIAAGERWAAGAIPGLVLHGPVGRGKTVIAACAAMDRCVISRVRWLSVARLLLDLRMPFASDEYARAGRALDPGKGVALVLDDLDKLKPTEHALQPLYVAIDGWVSAGAPLLVTMNRRTDELAEWCGDTFGEALASRLGGYCEEIEVGGRDRRLS